MQLCLGLKILPVQTCFDAGRATRVRRQEAAEKVLVPPILRREQAREWR